MTEIDKTVKIAKVVSVGDFARALDVGVAKVVGELMKNGVMATVNEQIDFDTAAIIGGELGFRIEQAAEEAEERPNQAAENRQTDSDQQARPPIVAVMGHVDHGKTSLLDAIRESDVAGGEAGGITQHIGAYQVTKNNRKITFLDTPGHEAFGAIRAHGAKMTDVAIIVVAADDGVKPQTKEAIEHAKAAKVNIVVAISKIDKPEADENRVKQELSEQGLVPDDWGGDIPCVPVSAKSKEGIDKLLDVVLLVADILEPKSSFSGLATGVIIESHKETGRGPVVTVLVQKGCLKLNDNIVAGNTIGKIRSLEDYRGRKIKEATPGMPAVVSGLKAVPNFGDWFEIVASEKIAKEWSDRQSRKESFKSLTSVKSVSAQDIAKAVIDGQVKELAVIVKADVQGSLESLTDSLESIGNEEVRVKIVSSGVGDISENDINSAAAGNALILGFNVSIKAAVNQLAKRAGVEFRLYKIIYELLDDVRDWLSSLLEPEIIETEHARLEILGIFKVTKQLVITGGVVKSGKITPNLDIKIERADKVVGAGSLTSLQKEKQAASEVFEGEQCGLSVATSDEIKLGDTLIFYSREQKSRKL